MKKPEEVLNAWMKAVNNGDITTVAFLYNDKAILIPTFSNRILNTPKKILDYFEALKTREHLSVSLHEKTVKAQKISESLYTMSGIYRWQFDIDEEPITFEARFSYLLDLNLEKPILHHHSSQIPRML